uniref:Uncharacterized protein n=1 Tax=Knipowitschia caucasica TaxID=637954 RepID=A0AAV2KDQ0_KNICA
MAMEQGRVTEFEGKSLDQIQIEPEGRAVEILSQTDGLKETSSGEPSTIHPDAPHGSGSAPSERKESCGPRPVSPAHISPAHMSPAHISPAPVSPAHISPAPTYGTSLLFQRLKRGRSVPRRVVIAVGSGGVDLGKLNGVDEGRMLMLCAEWDACVLTSKTLLCYICRVLTKWVKAREEPGVSNTRNHPEL